MREKLIFSIITLFLIFCGAFIYCYQSHQKGKNIALAAVYESAEKLYEHSNLIVIGKIGDYEEIPTNWGHKVIERLDNVEVSKLISNTSGAEMKNSDPIT